MNGAELIMRTAKQAGVDVCFVNFGTTEMPLALAFDSEPGIKPVLGLFEGVCTGAADGFGRMMDKPAMTLLHLGPGLANGIANLHVARRAHSPILNVIGDHTTRHVKLDPPLAMNIEALAGTVSGWYRSNRSPGELSHDFTDAYSASLYGQIATLSIPNDYQMQEIKGPIIATPHFAFDPVNRESIEKAAHFMGSHQKVAFILGGRVLRLSGLQVVSRLKALSGCDLLCDHLPGYMDRGAGLPELTRIPYFPEQAIELLSRYEGVVIAGTREPVSFFGYKGVRENLLTDDQPRFLIVGFRQNPVEALEYLADLLNAPKNSDKQGISESQRPSAAKGDLTAEKACQTLAALQPEGAIIVDEGVSSASPYYTFSRGLPLHSILNNSGGSIGYGMPCSIGAAIACPDRPVINLQADGSAMYTVQALWTQARLNLDITTLICANRCYNILKMELNRANITAFSPNISSLVDLENPHINWVKMAEAMGVSAVLVNTGEELSHELKRALSESGPHLIEMAIG